MSIDEPGDHVYIPVTIQNVDVAMKSGASYFGVAGKSWKELLNPVLGVLL